MSLNTIWSLDESWSADEWPLIASFTELGEVHIESWDDLLDESWDQFDFRYSKWLNGFDVHGNSTFKSGRLLQNDLHKIVPNNTLFNQDKVEKEVRDYLYKFNFWNRQESTFIPDDWTVSMIVWVIKHVDWLLQYKDKISLIELWVWEWSIVKYIFSNYKDKINKIVWLDICDKAVSDANIHLESLMKDNPDKIDLHVSNLLKGYNSKILDNLDFIYACLPQVRFVGTKEERNKIVDFYAHYYEDEEFKNFEFNKFWLGLIEQTLKESSINARNQDILLNLAWRIPKEILFDLFHRYWYSPEIMYEKLIPQHWGTSLDMFIDLEEKWLCKPEFFDEEGIKITAQKAKNMIWDWLKVFHKIYVIKGISNTYSA